MTDANHTAPSYGLVNRYVGPEGEQYFQRQSQGGFLGAKFNEFIFRPYINADDDLLEFGCGGGFMLYTLPARKKVGVEINPAARSHAERLGLLMFSTLDEIHGETFSRIITSHTLEHVPNPAQALIKMRQLLRPDGLLIWLSPVDDWRSRRQRQWSSNDPDMHLYTWTPLLIGNLLKSAGYTPRNIRMLTHAFPPLGVGTMLWKINPSLFHVAARFWAVLRRQRQVVAVASPSE